jgi:hypothetical protein
MCSVKLPQASAGVLKYTVKTPDVASRQARCMKDGELTDSSG